MHSWPLLPYAFALLLAVPFLIFLRNFVFGFLTLKKQELKLLAAQGISGQRVQAYERLTLFLDRLKPANLIQRFDSGLAPHEFVFLTDKTIKEEFEYNAAQQLYLSKQAWEAVTNAKNYMLQLLHKTYGDLGEGATLEDFKTVFLMNYMNGADPIAAAMDLLRKETLIVN